jgi:trk system potassium uptake protein TrkH
MPDLRPVFLVIGLLLTTLGLIMIIPELADLSADGENNYTFLKSAIFSLFVGISLTFSTRGYETHLSIRQAFILTTLSWLVLVAFAALPFYFSPLEISYTDAFFEAMSGLTTTGSTALTGLDVMPTGILLWRSILQWIGGIGIIVMALAILPMLQVGGMQIFKTESSDTSDKIMPRITQIAGTITFIYIALSLACAIAYYLTGMTPFNAAAHAMTTVSTGGFSTSDASFGQFGNVPAELVSVSFMLVAALPFGLYIHMIRGDIRPLLKDPQVRWFLILVALSIFLVWAYIALSSLEEPVTALRHATFNVISIVTGTGYSTMDYGLWGGFAVAYMFTIQFIGGCAGSTSCGIKPFRFQIITQHLKVQIKRLVHPHGIYTPRFNGKRLPEPVISSVMGFVFIFFICFVVQALMLVALGLDIVTSLSAAATIMANVGPGFGDIIGPAGSFAPLPDAAKWVLSAGMLLGRLEFFTVLILFTPSFWRN